METYLSNSHSKATKKKLKNLSFAAQFKISRVILNLSAARFKPPAHIRKVINQIP